MCLQVSNMILGALGKFQVVYSPFVCMGMHMGRLKSNVIYALVEIMRAAILR